MNNLRYLKKKYKYKKLFDKIGLNDVLISEKLFISSISTFEHRGSTKNLKFTNSILNKAPSSITLAPIKSIDHKNIIKVDNPKYFFFKIVSWINRNIGFEPLYKSYVSKTAIVHNNAIINNNVLIGSGTKIASGVVIYPNVKIGINCIIEANTVIGNSGFAVINENSKNLMVPHVGGVMIGNNVRIGALSTIDKATIGLTIIGNNSKIDNRVHIAHNCVIGERNIVCAGTNVAGGALIGNNCWLGLGCNIKQKVKIANQTYIGIGSNIFQDTAKKDNMIGYPSKKKPRLKNRL